MSVKITKVDTMPESDPYNNGSASRTTFWLDPQEREAIVSQDYKTNSTTFAIYHRCELELSIGDHPVAADVREYLESEDTQRLLDTICDGHSIEWNGHNNVGRLTDDAQLALDTLEQDLADRWLGSGWAFWDVEEWLGESVKQIISTTTTDEEIAKLAQEAEEGAKQENIILSGDVADYFTSVRDEMRDEADDE